MKSSSTADRSTGSINPASQWEPGKKHGQNSCSDRTVLVNGLNDSWAGWVLEKGLILHNWRRTGRIT